MELFIVILIILILGIAYLIFENKNLVVTDYFIEQEKIPEAFHGMRFVCITDLHNNCYGKNNIRLLKHIYNLKPDAILISGDMITAREPKKSKVSLALLKELANHYPVYYSPGNHELKWQLWEEETHSGDRNTSFASYVANIKDAGVTYLDNNSIILQKKDQTLQITGLNIPLTYYKKGGKPDILLKKDITDLVGDANEHGYQILLAHMPIYFETYAIWGADFVLSGHVHGGVMRLPFLGGVISPQYELFPKYDSGAYSIDNSIMLISRGLGTHTIPIRVFNRPELICIELKKKGTIKT